MGYGSSDRRGARARLVVLHTAEGARRNVDLAKYFDGNDDASSHAATDPTGILDMIPRERASWTLGSGNPVSVNVEMCAHAGMTREQWLRTDTFTYTRAQDGRSFTVDNPRATIRHTAAWARRECEALGIPKRVLTVAQIRAGEAGITDHGTANRAMGWGDHTDVGPNFPWDVFQQDLNGEEDDMPYTPQQLHDLIRVGASAALVEQKGKDNRNILDGVIQTRSELRDRAREAVTEALAPVVKELVTVTAQLTKTLAELAAVRGENAQLRSAVAELSARTGGPAGASIDETLKEAGRRLSGNAG